VTDILRALVLGGHGDIGRAIAARLHADGCDVVAVGRSTFDMRDPSQIDAFMAREGNRFELLVHCAGLNRPALFENLSDADIRESLEINLHGFLRVARACLPHWRNSGFGRV